MMPFPWMLRLVPKRPGSIAAAVAGLVIVACLVIGIRGFTTCDPDGRIESQLQLIMAGLRLYEGEHGEFPQPLDNSGAGSGGARALYQALSGDGDDCLLVAAAPGTHPSVGKPGSSGAVFVEGLDPGANKHRLVAPIPGGGYQIVDPFSQPWCYRKWLEGDTGETTHNRSYDLWSPGSGGDQQDEKGWTKNW